MGAVIKKIEYYLPSDIADNFLLEKEFENWNAQKIESKTGIRQRHIAGHQQTALDMAELAGCKALENYDRSKIDFLILCTQSPDYFLPTGACILQNKLKLSTKTGAFDYNLGCSGFVYGLAVAKSLINTEIAKNVLLIMSETYSKHIHPKDKGNRTIFGDGAAAIIIEKNEIEHIHNFSFGTDGSGYDKLIVKNGAMRNRYEISPEEITDGNGSIWTDNHLYMNGPEIFNFTIQAVPSLVEDVLRKHDCTIDSIDYFIFHQANAFILEHLRKKLKLPAEKFYIDLENTGNTVSATIPIAIKNAIETGRIKSGDRVLIAGFGVGYSWGGTIITI